MKISKMVQAEEVRYMKIQRLTDLLCNKEEKVVDHLVADGLQEPFYVGKKIVIDGKNIKIRHKRYSSAEFGSFRGKINFSLRHGKLIE